MEIKKITYKKILYMSLLLIILMISSCLFSSCCGLNLFNVTVVYKDVSGELGLEDYITKVKFKDGYSFSFIVPEGYEHTSISAKLITMDGNNIESDLAYKMELVDPTIVVDEEHLYSVDRKFTYTLDSVNRPLKIVIQMGGVKKRQFDVSLDGVDSKYYSAVKVDYKKEEYLTTLDTSKCIEFVNRVGNTVSTSYEKSFTDNKITLDYGTCLALVSTAPDSQLIDKFYGETTYFEYSNQKEENSKFVSYGIAKRGNIYYTYRSADNKYKKIYFIGDIKEDLFLSKNIPGYEDEKGFDIEKNPNTFYFFTPLTSLNSQTFSLEIYSTTESCWARDGENNVVKSDYIETINEDETTSVINLGLVSPNSIYKRKYDVYNMYIGEDKGNDTLIDNEYKQTLLDDIYIKIDNDEELDDIINMLLLSEEKQIVRDSLKDYELIVPKLTFDVLSSGGNKYAKLTYENLEDYIIKRPIEINGEMKEYSIGNCILYPEYDYAYRDKMESFFSISITLAFEDGIDFDGYNITPYLLLEDGSKDYGLLDYHVFKNFQSVSSIGMKGKLGNSVFFSKKNFIADGEYLANLYFDFSGPEYKGISQPLINSLKLVDSVGSFSSINLDNNNNNNNLIENRQVYRRIKISGPYEDYAFRFTCCVYPSVNLSTRGSYDINCENIDLPPDPAQVIYVTNDFNGSFERLFYADKDIISEIGGSKNFYYVSTIEDEYFDFDIYYIPQDLDGNNLEPIKISKTAVLTDITGRVIQTELVGTKYDIYIKYLIPIYERPPQGVYYIMKG